MAKSIALWADLQKASHCAQICLGGGTRAFLGVENVPMTNNFNQYKLTLLLLVFLIVSLLLMRFELLPLVSSCFSPLLFILLFNEFLLFTELDLDRLVAAKNICEHVLQTLGTFDKD